MQGVGFRPFVWKLAQRMGIGGEVLNDPEGVLILASGDRLDAFQAALSAEAPPLARVDRVSALPHAFAVRPEAFRIVASQGAGGETRVTPDAATCPDCAAEIRRAGERRHGYAFANCTHCGPRFSILKALPYDRSQTSMAAFGMCAECAAQYADPADRRFHAQPIACPACGPRLWLEVAGEEIQGDAVKQGARRLTAGEILAIRGLGGFHLACDATNAAAIATLRQRKHRPAKPFALMGTLDMIARHAALSDTAQDLLSDAAAPIVLLPQAGAPLPEAVAPGLALHGWMLPYTPLHHLLLDACCGPLVMTSANPSGEPQVTGNAEARKTLAGLADAFVMHDRAIVRRLDDSVERMTPHGPMVLRRARGRAPATLPLPPGFESTPEVAAFGGQLKSAICLLKNGQALLSHHLGDLDSARAWDAFCAADTDYAALFDHAPEIFACDLHPGYRSSVHAADRAGDGPLTEVQHHHGHLAGCLGENGWPLDGGAVAGIVLDGLGLGSDGTIWGGELLLGDYRGFRRAGRLRPAPLIGGDAAQRQPWRNLLARLDQAGLRKLADDLLAQHPVALARQAAAAGVNTVQSSSAGRLFDAFAAALDICHAEQSFEGEAAMRLEALAQNGAAGFADPYPLALSKDRLDPAPMFHAWAMDRQAGTPAAVMAARFHAGLARAFCTMARNLVETGQAGAVALSGGCFQNAVLLDLCMSELSDLPVLIHSKTPANDGGLAFGQALVAAAAHMAGRADGRDHA